MFFAVLEIQKCALSPDTYPHAHKVQFQLAKRDSSGIARGVVDLK